MRLYRPSGEKVTHQNPFPSCPRRQSQSLAGRPRPQTREPYRQDDPLAIPQSIGERKVTQLMAFLMPAEAKPVPGRRPRFPESDRVVTVTQLAICPAIWRERRHSRSGLHAHGSRRSFPGHSARVPYPHWCGPRIRWPIWSPSGEWATLETRPSCPARQAGSWALAASHTRTVPSADPADDLPSV